MKSSFLLLTLVFGLFALQPGHTQAAIQEPLGQKVLVDAADTVQLESLRASGAQRLVDYGAFSLWRLPADGPRMQASQVNNLEQVDDNIYLRGITLHPEQAEPLLPLALSSAAEAEGEGLWLVQFIGPTLPEWQAELQAAGLEIVAYVPNNAYLIWGRQPAAALGAAAAGMQAVQWNGAYHPLYRLEPSLRSLVDGQSTDGQLVDVSVQFYTTHRLAQSLQTLNGLAVQEYQPPVELLNTTVTRVQLPAQALTTLAGLPDVINIEPYQQPELLDEIQGQILAGNLISLNNSLVAAQPGYLHWLASKGFPQQPEAYPLVDIVDDGLDSGDASRILHPDFYALGQKPGADRIAFIQNCTYDASGESLGGHGHLNSGIFGGYNNLPGFPYQDAQGYRLGLGVSPFGSVAGTKIFNNSGVFSPYLCGSSYAAFVDSAYTNGTRITSNSWGAPVAGAYTMDSQAYDMLTRDGSAQTGNQEMLHIFAAGNTGPGAETIGSPGSAKNVLTVGAYENTRLDGIYDGCSISEGGSADDIAGFSSRGPTADGRIKPDILAPGTHVQAPASQSIDYIGGGICNTFYPKDQKLYSWSSGTSHSTPAIAGVAQLTYNYYQRALKLGAAPSPAMLKALILNTPRYLTGVYANDTLPSANQGWGSADMGKIFDGTPRMLFDQQQVFDKTGQTFEVTGQVRNPDLPFHVSLVWTDAPGSPSAANALVNNLDLEVTADGHTYRGNVFNGKFSITAGTADTRNNVENVFLAAGKSGDFRVRVIARGLSGDGIPNNEVAIDQDFALVIYNASVQMDHSYWMPFFFKE